LAQVEAALLQHKRDDYQFVLIGSGSEREWLDHHLQRVVFKGNLSGQSLARAYANFDLFLFPSLTDTFGNAVLEALASGVPAVVMNSGGPKFIIEPEKSGFVAWNEMEFADLVVRLVKELADPQRKQQLREAARERAMRFSWARAFEQVYEAYEVCLGTQRVLAVETNQAASLPTTSTVSKL
jgi:glycosyltransferase involved in cell wall biosynthesis